MSKGSAPRENRDDKKYAEGWERIFGKVKFVDDCTEPFCQCDPGKCEKEWAKYDAEDDGK